MQCYFLPLKMANKSLIPFANKWSSSVITFAYKQIETDLSFEDHVSFIFSFCFLMSGVLVLIE